MVSSHDTQLIDCGLTGLVVLTYTYTWP